MIALTRFDGSRFYINADLIEVVESNPDTHITLVNGHRYLVRESDADVVSLVIGYLQETQRATRKARNVPSPLRLVDQAKEA